MATLQKVSTENVDLDRRTRRAFEDDPSAYRIPRSLGITRNNRLGAQRQLARTAVGEARREIDRIAEDTRTHTTRWADRTLANEMVEGARDWTITERGAIERVSGLEYLDDEFIDEYVASTRSINTCDLEAFNLRVFDVEPNNLVAFMARNPVTGELRRGPDGRPFVPWQTFQHTLGRVLHAMLKEYGFPPGSFWIVQFLDSETDTVQASQFSTNAPALPAVMAALGDLNFGISEGSDIITNTYVRLIVGNPGTGAGGAVPAHLKGKRTVWSHKLEGYCAPASLVMCAATVNERKNLNRRPAELQRKIHELVQSTGRDNPTWGFDDLEAAAVQMGAQIIVVDAFALTMIYATHPMTPPMTPPMTTKLYLLLDQHQGHFMACYNPSSLHVEKSWCDKCRKLISRSSLNAHRCEVIDCWACHETFDTITEREAHFNTRAWESCSKCWRKMPAACHGRHEARCNGAFKKCPECRETFTDSAVSRVLGAITVEQHRAACGMAHNHCRICDKHLPKGHRCTITRTGEQYEHGRDQRKLVVFDIESTRDADGKQIPTFVSAREVLKSHALETKEAYTERLLAHFRGTPPLEFEDLESFVNWAVTQKRTDFIAHNLRGYDGVLIHSHMRYKMKLKTKPVFAGLKVMTFSFGTNRMIDSLNHIASSLAALPKTLGIAIPGVEKDHFPHKFNTIGNREYSGPLPAFEMFEPEEQSCGVDELKAWWVSESAKHADADNPWVLKDVEKRYCHQDTLVLGMAVGEYRRLCIEMTGLDPIKSTTIASYCMKVYRSKHIPIEGVPTLSKHESDFARRALKGGRTEVFKTYASGDLGYVDVVSLYPSRQYFEDMPYGVPRIHTGDDIPEDWMRGIGFAEVDITPPSTVPGVVAKDFVPLLAGYSADGKLRFDTTPKIGEVYTIAELAKAVQIGYTIYKVHEVHLYERRKDLFKSYVETFLKTKVESSPPPGDLDLCIDEHRDKFGIELDPAKLAARANPGMRSLAKLALNNLWGKMGQRELPATELCDPVAYFKLMTRFRKGEIEIESIAIDKDLEGAVSVSYKELTKKDEMVRLKNHVAIAAYVTSTARLKLYEVIGDPRLAGRVAYCDTDSCIYIKDPSGYNPPEGSSLGEWESEGEGFTEFVAIGPKFYSIRGAPGEKTRCKGFRMTNRAKELITFDSIKSALDSGSTMSVEYSSYFKRTKHAITVVPTRKEARYRPEGSKRRVIPGTHDLAPW